MEYFTTKAGTKLPLLDLRGKIYLQVAHRIQWFREEHPDWLIDTAFTRLDDVCCIAKAGIWNEEGKLKAVAHKREDHRDFPDFMEKAETGAIGRALAMLGYGTQFCAEELDEGSRLADSPMPRTRKEPIKIPKSVITTGAPAPAVSDAQRKLLWARLKGDLKLSDESAKDFLKTVTGKDSSKDWFRADFDAVMAAIDRKLVIKPIEPNVELKDDGDDDDTWDADRE